MVSNWVSGIKRRHNNRDVLLRTITWLLSDDKGLSSEFIVMHMIGKSRDMFPHHPRDAGDLGRCLRLLDEFPEWQARLGELAAHGAVWGALVANWGLLRASLKGEGGWDSPSVAESINTNRLMNQIIRTALSTEDLNHE